MQKSDKIPVLYLDNTYTFGGAINSLLYLLRALDKSRFTPILITAQPEDFLRQNFAFMERKHVKIKLPWVHNRIYKRIKGYKLFASGFGLKCVNRIRFLYWLIFITIPEAVRYYKIGRQHKVCLIHLNNIMGSQLAGILAAKFLRVPCIAHLREAVKDDNIFIIHDAIDIDDFDNKISCEYLRKEFNLENDVKLFGIFGRIIKWKGIKEFVQAAALIFQTIPNTKAFIVGGFSDGDDTYVEEVKELISSYGLNDNIILTGYRKDVPAIMQLMDLVVHASTKPESFGMVLIEGMAMGKPIVTTKMGRTTRYSGRWKDGISCRAG
jgi:glycosyltransferase involved in cell wall biosynthesis